MSISAISPETATGALMIGIGGSLIAAAVIFVLTWILARMLRFVPGRSKGPIPFVSFVPKHDFKDDKPIAEARLSNAGDTPAYNVEVFTVERWPDGQFRIESLGDHGLSTPTLGRNDSIELSDIDMFFEGCSVMVDSRYWIEYDNIKGEHFRAEAVPMSARGDAESASPPVRIRRRLERFPGSVFSGDFDEWEQIQVGIASFEVKPGPIRAWLLRRGRKRDGPILRTRRGEVVLLPECDSAGSESAG